MNARGRFSRQCLRALPLIVLIGLITAVAHQSASAQKQEDTSWQAKFFPPEKEEEFKQQVARKPQDAKLQYEFADAYLGVERWADAAAVLAQVVQLKPDFAAAWHDLGECYSYLGRYEEAVPAYQQAVKLLGGTVFDEKLSLPDVLHSLATAYMELRRYDEAIATWNQLLRITPSDGRYLYQVGRAYLAQGKREEATRIAGKLTPPYSDQLRAELAATAAPTMQANTAERAPVADAPNSSPAEPMTKALRPTILYKERAKYSYFARRHKVQGIVALSVEYLSNGQLGAIRVVRALPYGLTSEAIRAARKIRFEPARKDGQPVSVRGNIEFTFTLY